MKPKLAAALIVKGTKDEAPLLDACLANLKGHVNQFFLDINIAKGKKISPEIIKVAKKHKTDYVEREWVGNFVSARNENFARIPDEYDFILWVDTDDTIENPEKIREVCAITPKEVDGIYIKYDYATDEYGNVTVSHWVARVVRNNNTFHWKSSFSDADVTVHETLNERRKVGKVMNDEFWVVHHADEERKDRSLARNIELLEGMLKKSSDNPDARILYYLATHYVDASRLMEAKQLFEWYLKLSGWAEERSQAWVYLGMIYDAMQQSDNARGCYMRALAENPNDPNPYVELGELEIKEQLFQKAVYWLDMAVAKKLDPMASVVRPMDNTYRAYKLLSDAHANLGGQGYEKASEWLKKAKELRPFEPDLHAAQEQLDMLIGVRELTKATSTILNKLKQDDEKVKIVPFLENLPSSMLDNPLVASAKNYYREPKVWPAKSIAILCGMGPLGNWGPKALEHGVGGSEEAVIRVSKQLTDLGYHVTVFGTPGEEAGTHDGVDWRHYWELNRDDTFDIFISWRNPEFFDIPIKARKNYLWLHDVMEEEELIPERIANIDRIIFVSQYHRDLYPFLPEEKCFVSGNGITPEDFIEADGKFVRNSHRIIYMSSHVRGLQLIYDVWEDVKKEVPDAILDIYYGWGSYDAVNKNNPERMAWKEMMIKREHELKDVTDHGKIGQSQIVEEINKSGIWAYPCPFPEVYCITGVKAQAGGAIPVASNFAALKETVQFGEILDMKAQDEHTPVGEWDTEELDKFKAALIKVLKDSAYQASVRPKMMEWARTKMTWRITAEAWDADFQA